MKWILYDWFGLNRWVFLSINGQESATLDAVMQALSWMGDYRLFPVYLGVGMTVAWRLHQTNRDPGSGAVRHALWRFALGYAAGVLLVGALKVAFDLPRPLAVLGADTLRVIGSGESRYSFPSGHAAFAALIVVALWPTLRLRGRVALLLFAFGVGLSRVRLGLHFPADVVAGYLCGAAAAWLAQYIMMAVARRDRWSALALSGALAVFALDQSSKTAIVLALGFHESLPLTSYLNIGYWQNTGAAFGMFGQASGWQQTLFTVIGLVAACWMWRLIHAPRATPIERSAYAFIMGGAVGNVFDRVVRGAVVDWIDIHWTTWHWPAFNLADSGIALGVILLVVTVLRPLRGDAASAEK